jgi:hypothetical protein
MSSSLDDLLGNAITEPIADMAEDIDVDIDVVDDRPEEDRVEPRDPDRSASFDPDEDGESEIEQVGGRAQKRIKQLKYEYHEERRAKEAAKRMQEEAIRYAQNIEQENRQLRGTLERGEKVLLSEIHSRTDSQLNAAKEAYKQAYEQGDSDAILEAQESLNQSMIDAKQASMYQPVVEDQNRMALQQQEAVRNSYMARIQEEQRKQAAVDPKLQEWLGENKWFGQDREMTQFAYGVHEKLVREENIHPQSDVYYEKINERMKQVFPNKFGGDMGTGDPAASSRSTTVVAPAKRASGSPRKVQLTSTQVSLAKRLGLTPEQYAKQLLKEKQRG